MIRHWKVALALGGVVAVGALIVFWPPGGSLQTVMRGYGFTEVRPPSTLYPAGTVIEIVRKQPVVIDIVCTQTASLGQDIRVNTSATASSDLTHKVSRTFDLDANYLKQLLGAANMKNVSQVTFSLSNAAVSQLSADEVLAHVGMRKPECQRAIEAYLRQGRKLSMISATLRADMRATVKFDAEAKLTAQQKQKVVEHLSTALKLGYSASDSGVVAGTGLDWGIRDNAWWTALRSDTTLAPVPFDDPTLSAVRQRLADSLQDIGKGDKRTAEIAEAIAVARDTVQATRPVAAQQDVVFGLGNWPAQQ